MSFFRFVAAWLTLSTVLEIGNSLNEDIFADSQLQHGEESTTGPPSPMISPGAVGGDTAASNGQFLPSYLTDDEENSILLKFNYGRRTVSPAPNNMNYVFWDASLADAAQEMVDTCQYLMAQPDWLDTERVVVPYLGYTSDSDLRLPEIVDELFNLGRYYDYKTKYCSVNSFYCKIFKMVTWYSMTAIGCAQQYCRRLDNTFRNTVEEDVIFWKCNYENVGDYRDNSRQAYDAAEEGTCVTCESGLGWCTDGLCDPTCQGGGVCSCALDCSREGLLDADTCTCECDDGYTGTNCQIFDWPWRYPVYGTTITPNWWTTRSDVYTDDGVPEATVIPVTDDMTSSGCAVIIQCPDNLFFSECYCECVCPEGYYRAYNTCMEIDECATQRGGCEYECSNTIGSFVCTCDYGFALAANGQTCNDVNECDTDSGGCSHDCFNTHGSYYCECDIGHELSKDKHGCQRVAPPTRPRLLQTPCDSNNGGCEQRCVNEGGGLARCDCFDGYELNADYVTCKDIDECAHRNGGCEHSCVNTTGSYRCECPVAYILNYDDHTCDMDFCSMGSHCNGNGVMDRVACQCYCASGYTGLVCETPCESDDKSCWPTYTPPLTRYDSEHCPIACSRCGCPRYPVCRNGGIMHKVAEYEYNEGMCMCYCPYPWSGKSCNECNVSCLNGGSLDMDNCNCWCRHGWYGIRCEKPCVQTSMLCTSRSQPYCDSVALVAEKCPILCDICEPVSK